MVLGGVRKKMPTSSLQKRLFPREIRNSVDYLATWDHSSLHLDRSIRVCRAQRREVRGGGGGGAAVVARSGTTRTTLRSAASVDAGSRTSTGVGSTSTLTRCRTPSASSRLTALQHRGRRLIYRRQRSVKVSRPDRFPDQKCGLDVEARPAGRTEAKRQFDSPVGSTERGGGAESDVLLTASAALRRRRCDQAD